MADETVHVPETGQLDAGSAPPSKQRRMDARMDALEKRVGRMVSGRKAASEGVRHWVISLERHVQELHIHVEQLEALVKEATKK